MSAESPGPIALIPAANPQLSSCQCDVRRTRWWQLQRDGVTGLVRELVGGGLPRVIAGSRLSWPTARTAA
jgi:hypothetical protein